MKLRRSRRKRQKVQQQKTQPHFTSQKNAELEKCARGVENNTPLNATGKNENENPDKKLALHLSQELSKAVRQSKHTGCNAKTHAPQDKRVVGLGSCRCIEMHREKTINNHDVVTRLGALLPKNAHCLKMTHAPRSSPCHVPFTTLVNRARS